MREKKISNEALAVLSECVLEGKVVKINTPQLPRPLYEEVNSVLVAIGGKWNRFAKGHVFTGPENEISDMLEGCLATGIAVPLRPSGYFRTPELVVNRMVDLAEIKPGMSILEPSAGDGAIADGINISGVELTCIENDPKLYKILLENLGYLEGHLHANTHVLFKDFLQHDGKYDRVLMNPPFIRLSEIGHIKHAFSLLKQGGRLVSVASSGVTFRREPTAIHFRKLVDENGRIEQLPAGSFKESGTMVNCVLVILERK